MPIFSQSLNHEVRMERMRPSQIDAAKKKQPAIYVPFGSLEWHGRQNPVGLDALKAHELLVGLALKAGGLVYPPVFFGCSGSHLNFPNTYMVDAAAMETIALQLLHLFERDGFRAAVLLSGHGPNMGFLDKTVGKYKSDGGQMRVLQMPEYGAPGVFPDHAAKNETSFMMYLHPETVDMNEIGGPVPSDLPVPGKTFWMGDVYKRHPLYGIAGEDPRKSASVEVGKIMTERFVDYLTE